MSSRGYSDREMILLLQSNDEVAVWLIFDNYWESLFLVAFNIVKDRFIAEDIVQETIIAVWDKRNDLTLHHSLKAYLFASIRHAAYKEWKRVVTQKRESLDDVEMADHYCLFEDFAYQDLKTQVNQVVDELPDRCREVYLLSREDQLSHKEIAERMNISVKTVENQLTKALRKLRVSLDKMPFLAVFIHFLK